MRLAIVFALMATPSFAMTQDECNGALDVIAQMASGGTGADVGATTLTDNGWCRVVPGQTAAPFSALEWRADGIAAFINEQTMPLSINVVAYDFEFPDSDKYTLELQLQRVPDETKLVINRLSLVGADEGDLTLSAVFEGAVLDNFAAAQASVGGMTLSQLNLDGDVTPALVADLVPYLDDDQIVDHIAELSFDQLDRQSKSEVLEFARALPNVTGDLELALTSDTGIGAMQIGMAQTQEGAEAVAFALSGAQVTVDWQPK